MRPDLHRQLFFGFMAICSGVVALCLGVAAAVTGASPVEMWRDWRFLVLVVVALAALLAGSGAATYVIRGALQPLQALRRSLRDSARRRYRVSVDAAGPGEVVDLAQDIEQLRLDLSRVVERTEEETQRLLELSRLPGLIDAQHGEEDAGRAALDSVLRAVGCTAGALYLLDEEGASLRMSTSLGLRSSLAADTTTVPATHGFMGRVLSWGQALVLDEEGASHWLSEVLDADTTASGVACIPLRSGDQATGVVNLVLPEGEPLGADQVAMLETIAAQIGATLANARVFAAARRRLDHIDVLLDTSAEVARGRRTRQVLDLVLSKVRDLTGVPKCAVLLLEVETEEYQVASHTGLSGEFVERLAALAPKGPTHSATRELRPVIVSSTRVDHSVADLFVAYRDEGIESLLVVPLLGAESVYGTIEMYRDAEGAFSREETQLLSILANQAAIALTNARLHEESDARLSALETIVETMALFGASSDPDQIVNTAVRKVREVFRCDTCHICLRNPATGRLELQASIGLPVSTSLSDGLDAAKCWAVQKGSPFAVRDAGWDLTCEQEACDAGRGSHLCAPLTAGGECFGVMHMSSERARAFSPESERLFATIAEQVAIAAQRAQLFQQVQELATTDPMTGAHNYRRFRDRLDRDLNEARRYERTLSLILMDIDHFKQHNDTFGHPSGDEVLRKVAKVVAGCVRTVDFFARYGGEEFVVILPETEKDGARAVAEKIRAAIAETKFYGDPENPAINKTMSLGVATFPDDGDSDEELISSADRALYRAKESGRDRVETA